MNDRLISLCVIARDEASVLKACLQSARSLVDEIIVVDTGSKDETVEIARAGGARVLHHEWRDDFAAARNASLEQARGRFVLVLDADERLVPGSSHDQLRRQLRTDDAAEAWTVTVHDDLDDGTTRCYDLVRLFRNRDRHRYRGTIHEQITPAIADSLGRDEVEPCPSGLQVRHLGYLAQHVARQQKGRRNLSMLYRAVERDPTETSLRFFLVRELVPMRGGRAVPGEHLSGALEHAGWLAAAIDDLPRHLRSEFVQRYAAALIADGRPREARDLIATLAGDTAAVALLRADLACTLEVSDPARLLEAVERLRGWFDRPVSAGARLVADEPALSGALARAAAARLLLAAGQLDAARTAALEAVALEGGGAAPSCTLAAVERARGDVTAALAAYAGALRIDPRDPWAWAGLGETLLEAGQVSEALGPLRNAAALAPGWRRVDELLHRANAALVPDSRTIELGASRVF